MLARLGLQKYLNVRRVRSQGMSQRLKHGHSIVGTIAFPAQGGERQPVGGAIGKVESTVGVEVLVLRVDKAFARRFNHSIIFGTGRRLRLEPVNFYEIVELLLAHRWRSSAAPMRNIFGCRFTLLTNDPFFAAFRFQSAGERNVGLILRDSFRSASCKAL